MNNLDLTNTDAIIYIIKIIFISLYTHYTFLRILNKKNYFCKNFLIVFLFSCIISIICKIIHLFDSPSSTICLFLLLSLANSITTKTKMGYCLLVTLLSLSINYIIYFIAIFIDFYINTLFSMCNKYMNLLLIVITHLLILLHIFRIKRFKNGLAFLQKNYLKDEYFDILILNISIVIWFSYIIFGNVDLSFRASLFFGFIIFGIIMVITIKKSLTLYYKHKLLVQDLTETKSELEKANEKITQLEAENLNFSKTSHSIAHKQKALEYKLNTLLQNTEFSDELGISKELLNISKVSSIPANAIVLPKTNIEEIDNMLNFMQSECTKNNIDFELILSGNIHHIINTYISKEDLEILLADLIKNSIIAINNSDNINRSLLVKLGLFNNNYIISVYDSGIEFKLETLSKLGQEPCSTHLDNGGTGMGFMNIFDTLRKSKSSITINEINYPSKDNYTKFICITFDNKQLFEIISYKKEANSSIELSKV